MPNPLKEHSETIRRRFQLAEEIRREMAEAVAACGSDASAYGYWELIDRLGNLPPRRVYCCNRGNGWEPRAPFDDELIYTEPLRFLNGKIGYPFRYELHFCSLKPYSPLSEEQLEERRKKREKRKLPLFAAQLGA